MDPAPAGPRHEAIDHDDRLVHNWRLALLTALGISWPLGRATAGHVDWHQVASLVRRGCPLPVPPRIVR
jgi:hypothetical protein